MKKIAFATLLVVLSLTSFAQERIRDKEEEDTKSDDTRGFKKENLFTGGGLDFGISTYTTILGANPVLGYSISKWLDAGILFNFDYTSQKIYDPYYGIPTGDKVRQTILGPGAFFRVYPISAIFIQGQYEYNFIRVKEIYADGSTPYRYNLSAPSFLAGAGYCTGREDDSKEAFFYLSVMFDVLANKNSPYVQTALNGSVSILPIIRGGIQIPIFQGRPRR